MIRFPREWNSLRRITGSMRRFSQVVDDLELKDILVQGAPTLGEVGRITEGWLDLTGFWYLRSGNLIFVRQGRTSYVDPPLTSIFA